MNLRREVARLVSDGLLLRQRADHAWALELMRQAEEYLESARGDRREGRNLAALDGYYQAVWDSLRAIMAEYGLAINRAPGEDGKHVVAMRFGAAELRDSAEELEAGASLEPMRQQRNQNHYRKASSRLGPFPKVAVSAVAAARRRVDED